MARPTVSRSLVPGAPSPAAATDTVLLDAERLEVYVVARELHVLAMDLAAAASYAVRDQLERASLSAILNVAEGAGRRSSREKAHFYAIARGSATETAAIIDVLALRGLAPAAACRQARGLAVRVVQMLTRLEAAVARRPGRR